MPWRPRPRAKEEVVEDGVGVSEGLGHRPRGILPLQGLGRSAFKTRRSSGLLESGPATWGQWAASPKGQKLQCYGPPSHC